MQRLSCAYKYTCVCVSRHGGGGGDTVTSSIVCGVVSNNQGIVDEKSCVRLFQGEYCSYQRIQFCLECLIDDLQGLYLRPLSLAVVAVVVLAKSET